MFARGSRLQDSQHDVGVYDKTPCQRKLIDYVHQDLVEVNSKAYWTFSLLVIVILVNRNVAKQFVENDDPPDPFTKLIVAVLLFVAGMYAMRLVFSAALQWVYSYTSIMFVLVGLASVPVIATAWWVVWKEKKRLFAVTNALLIALEAFLFISAVFGGFFTGDLQSISEMYHENWDVFGDDIERAFPGICDGLDRGQAPTWIPDPLRAQCKGKLKELTLDQLQTAVNLLMVLSFVILIIVFLTWRAVINLNETIFGMHGLSQFDIDTIEKVVYLRREEIIGASDLYWEILHHPHRPINQALLGSNRGKKAKGSSDIDVGKLESTLREAERLRIKSMTPTTLENECMKNNLHPTGSVNTLRRRLLQNYSCKRMSSKSKTSKKDSEHAEQHFFELGEPELRLIPALAFCPFLDRLLDVFSEDGTGFLHFEEFLNLYSVFSEKCPMETKIRYAWCIYDLNATGDIGRDEVQALVMQLLGLSQHDLVSEGHAAVEGEETTENPLSGGADLANRVKGGGDAEEAARIDSLWGQMDLDGSGMLEEPELRGVLESMGPEWNTEAKFKKVWKELDKDRDGGVSQQEFLKWWLKQKKKARGGFEQQLSASAVARAEDDLAGLDELNALGMGAEPEPEPEPEAAVQPKPPPRAKPRSRDEEAQRLAALWHEMDLDGSGQLDFAELTLVVEKMNPQMSEKKKKKILSQLDDDNDGCLTQVEFMKWWMSQKAETRDLIAGEDMPEKDPGAGDIFKKLVTNPLHFVNGLGNTLAPTPAQLEKARNRRSKLRNDKFQKAEEKRAKEKAQTEKDVNGLMDMLMAEVDEDGDDVVNFHEFRKALLQAPQFQENFQLPFPDATDLLIYPQAEESTTNNDDVLLTPEEHKELMRFSTGHRRRRKSLTDEENEAARMAKMDRDRRGGRSPNGGSRSPRSGGSPRAVVTAVGAVGGVAKDVVDATVVRAAQGVHKKARKAVKKIDPEVEARRKEKWAKFNLQQEERQKMLAKHNSTLGDNISPDGLHSQKRNPHQFRSIYSQLIAQRQLEIRDEMRRIKNLKNKKKEREKARKAHEKAVKEAKTNGHAIPVAGANGGASTSTPGSMPLTPHSPGDMAANAEQAVIDAIGIDWNTFDIADMEGSLAFRSVRAITDTWLAVAFGVLGALESIQNQDKIPFWIKDVQSVEGDFGAGVASVFSLKRWLFSINAYMAFAWVCFVIMPYLIIKDSALGKENMGGAPSLSFASATALSLDDIMASRGEGGSGSFADGLDEDQDEFSNSTMFGNVPPRLDKLSGPAWLYYSSYPARLGTYRLDFAYFMTLIVLFIMNIAGVIRNIAYTIAQQFQKEIHDDEHTFEAASLLFAGYDFRACLRSIVEQNQRQTRNYLKTLLMKERAKAYRNSVGLKGRLRRGIGLALCTALAGVMGASIVWTLQNSAWLQANKFGIPNATNNIITLIKIAIPNLIPPIVQLEGRKDTSVIMMTIIQRVYLCQIVSLGLMFKELNDMQRQAAKNGECFENLAGNIYMRSLLTDFAATMITLCIGYLKKWATYIRYVRGGFLGQKEPVPQNIAVVLTKMKLPEYDAEEAAIECISNMYRQCVIWVGATVSPAMALAGMANNFLLFFVSKWATKDLYRPPSDPWGGDEAKALNSKLVFLTLLFSAGPLLAWVVSEPGPSCGPHKGQPVINVYADYMENDVSEFVKNTVGAATVFLFDGPPLFLMLTFTSVVLYFKTAQNASLTKAVEVLQKDFALQHKERVAIVQQAMAFESQGFVLPRAWENEKIHSRRLDPLEGIQDLESITWDQVNEVAPQLSKDAAVQHQKHAKKNRDEAKKQADKAAKNSGKSGKPAAPARPQQSDEV